MWQSASCATLWETNADKIDLADTLPLGVPGKPDINGMGPTSTEMGPEASQIYRHGSELDDLICWQSQPSNRCIGVYIQNVVEPSQTR